MKPLESFLEGQYNTRAMATLSLSARFHLRKCRLSDRRRSRKDSFTTISKTPHVSDPTAPWALIEMGGEWIVAGQHLIGAQYRHLFAY